MGLIAALFGGFLGIFTFFSSYRWIKKSYENSLNAIRVFDEEFKDDFSDEKLERRRRFEDLFKEDYAEDDEPWVR
jgi:hypothetical protein